MGLLVDGTWHDQWYDTASTGGPAARSCASWSAWRGSSPPLTEREPTATAAPARVSAVAMASPIPDSPPVTIAIFPERSVMIHTIR